jgi:formylglycine-generating enzyme required for sulfatase activity
MASRQMKMPVKNDVEKSPETEDVFSQRRRPELGRYLLQVDRQTKGSYTTSNAAQSAALAIKTDHPVVQVSVYDAVENTNTIVEAPPAPEHVTSGGDAASAPRG